MLQYTFNKMSIFGHSFSRPNRPKIPTRLRKSISNKPLFVSCATAQLQHNDNINVRTVVDPLPVTQTKITTEVEEKTHEQTTDVACDAITEEQEWAQLQAYLGEMKDRLNALLEQFNDSLEKIVKVNQEMEKIVIATRDLDVRVKSLEDWRVFEIKDKSKENTSFTSFSSIGKKGPETVQEEITANIQSGILSRVSTWRPRHSVTIPPLIVTSRNLSQKDLFACKE